MAVDVPADHAHRLGMVLLASAPPVLEWLIRLSAHAHLVSNLTPPLANALHAQAHTLQIAHVQLALMSILHFASALLALVLIPKTVDALYAVECREWKMTSL
mmetsp:Transcript_18697/g.31827  ORF Transcript_18697/g.31827 Transcript_18697/m.31827 type:complete len:102 (+) Transcript_18697:70-375(+)